MVRREVCPPTAGQQPPTLSKVDDWTTFASRGELIGRRDAPVLIVEWGDFQCPFCRLAFFAIDSIMKGHPGEVALLYRHYPNHAFAHAAARAGICADRQGAFSAMYEELFKSQEQIGQIA
jgi:protein-disulfide isomerase